MPNIELRTSGLISLPLIIEGHMANEAFGQMAQANDRSQSKMVFTSHSLLGLFRIFTVRCPDQHAILYFPVLGTRLPTLSIEIAAKVVCINPGSL